MNLAGIQVRNGPCGQIPAGGNLKIHQDGLTEGASQLGDNPGHVILRLQGEKGAALLANEVKQQ